MSTLESYGVQGMTVLTVHGYGHQRGRREVCRRVHRGPAGEGRRRDRREDAKARRSSRSSSAPPAPVNPGRQGVGHPWSARCA
ncbi:P-II family nitrogen regulator [Kocuria rhizophila]|nr:P-II family nitrogen regulator [Kocuria rhizophila]